MKDKGKFEMYKAHMAKVLATPGDVKMADKAEEEAVTGFKLLPTASVVEEDGIPEHAVGPVGRAKKKAKSKKKIVVEDWRSARKAGSLVHACSGGMPVCKWRQSPTKGFFKQEPYCFASPAEAFLERSLCRGCQLQLPQEVSKEIAPFL